MLLQMHSRTAYDLCFKLSIVGSPNADGFTCCLRFMLKIKKYDICHLQKRNYKQLKKVYRSDKSNEVLSSKQPFVLGKPLPQLFNGISRHNEIVKG